MKIVYVLLEDFGPYDGGSIMLAIYDTRKLAEEHKKEWEKNSPFIYASYVIQPMRVRTEVKKD